LISACAFRWSATACRPTSERDRGRSRRPRISRGIHADELAIAPGAKPDPERLSEPCALRLVAERRMCHLR
jgi:hypothetical protein